MKTATAKVGGITQNVDLGYACFQEKYYRACIAIASFPGMEEGEEKEHLHGTHCLRMCVIIAKATWQN